MTVRRLIYLLNSGHAEIIDGAAFALYREWMRPQDVKRRATA
jgi:hypothetical protein